MIPPTDTVLWIDATKSLPDSDVVVLIHVPDCAEPVWLGYHDGDVWLSCTGFALAGEVTHWAELPAPPAAPQVNAATEGGA